MRNLSGCGLEIGALHHSLAVPEAATRRAVLEAELATPRGRVELEVVERRQGERQVPRDDGLASHHLRRRTAPVGSVFAPATKASSQPSTGDVDVPRICRTASFRLLRPWMKASESCPPFVLQTSRPCGQARPPFSTNGPPSPRGQK